MATTFNGLAMQRRISHRGSEHQCIDCSQQVCTLDRAGVANIDGDYRSPICLECRYNEPSKSPGGPDHTDGQLTHNRARRSIP
jgi:hypothetical protein